MDTQGPTTHSFKYVLIPADDAKDVSEVYFDGGSDEALRKSIQQYFRRQLLSEPQKAEMAKHLVEKASENSNKAVEAGKGNDEVASVMMNQQDGMIADFVEQTSFEIVPLIMPGRQNKFIGTSLYIDDSGRFKELPLNPRASKIAQRDIRGDAFLLSNHDDPALDEWSRVDCTIADYESIHQCPPTTSYDASNRAQMASEAMLRERDTKRISEEEIVSANKAKTDGNAYFANGDLDSAVKAYSEAVDLTEGRRDLLQDEAAATALRVTALLNRSLCFHRLGKNSEAARDARWAIQLDDQNIKAHYRLAVALCGDRDYDAAEAALKVCEHMQGSTTDTAALRQAITEGRHRFTQEQKQKYSKLFA